VALQFARSDGSTGCGLAGFGAPDGRFYLELVGLAGWRAMMMQASKSDVCVVAVGMCLDHGARGRGEKSCSE
jgi:hypothetical protein